MHSLVVRAARRVTHSACSAVSLPSDAGSTPVSWLKVRSLRGKKSRMDVSPRPGAARGMLPRPHVLSASHSEAAPAAPVSVGTSSADSPVLRIRFVSCRIVSYCTSVPAELPFPSAPCCPHSVHSAQCAHRATRRSLGFRCAPTHFCEPTLPALYSVSAL